MRIEAGRRLFPLMWFNAPEGANPEDTPTCQGGIDAIGWYHEKKDEIRNIGLGPDHDWSSHGADSFGLMCVVYEQPGDDDEDDYEEPTPERTGYCGYR
jgi:phage terminase large subunit